MTSFYAHGELMTALLAADCLSEFGRVAADSSEVEAAVAVPTFQVEELHLDIACKVLLRFASHTSKDTTDIASSWIRYQWGLK